MNKRQILKKLEELYNIKEVKEGFPSQQACINWANKVAPLLKFNQQYYYNFLQNAHKINLPLSSYTLGPALKVMESQVQMAIEELRLAIDNESNKSTGEPVACGPLAKDTCDLDNTIKKEFSPRNIFLDIPYTNYEDCEEALRDILSTFDLQPIVAKDRLTSNAVLCKVCKLIKTCKYGIADISSGSNSVSYEYGLMHGFGMKVCLLLRSESEKFTDIHGLEHLSYDGLRKFKITVAKWILDNIVEVSKEKNEKFLKSEDDALRNEGEIPLKKIKIITEPLPELDIILSGDRRQFGSSSGGGRKGYNDIGYALPFRIRNKSNINICLEDVKIENELLGKSRLDKTNPRLSKLPYNVGARMTEELQLLFKFPNEVAIDMKGKDIKLQVEFDFSDRTVTREVVGYL
jgi:hypothetical protein